MEMSISVSDLCFIHAHLLTYQRSFFSFNGTDVDLDFSSPSFSHTPFSQFCARSLMPHAPSLSSASLSKSTIPLPAQLFKLCPMPCVVLSLTPRLSYCAISRIAPSLVSHRLSYHAVSCIVLSLVVSRITPSLVLCCLSYCAISRTLISHHLFYCAVSHVVSHTHSTLATLVPHALSHVCIALSHVLPCLSCHLSCPVSL
jgi:hypothetical protein